MAARRKMEVVKGQLGNQNTLAWFDSSGKAWSISKDDVIPLRKGGGFRVRAGARLHSGPRFALGNTSESIRWEVTEFVVTSGVVRKYNGRVYYRHDTSEQGRRAA